MTTQPLRVVDNNSFNESKSCFLPLYSTLLSPPNSSQLKGINITSTSRAIMNIS